MRDIDTGRRTSADRTASAQRLCTPAPRLPAAIVALQRAAGNQAVASMLRGATSVVQRVPEGERNELREELYIGALHRGSGRSRAEAELEELLVGANTAEQARAQFHDYLKASYEADSPDNVGKWAAQKKRVDGEHERIRHLRQRSEEVKRKWAEEPGSEQVEQPEKKVRLAGARNALAGRQSAARRARNSSRTRPFA